MVPDCNREHLESKIFRALKRAPDPTPQGLRASRSQVPSWAMPLSFNFILARTLTPHTNTYTWLNHCARQIFSWFFFATHLHPWTTHLEAFSYWSLSTCFKLNLGKTKGPDGLSFDFQPRVILHLFPARLFQPGLKNLNSGLGQGWVQLRSKLILQLVQDWFRIEIFQV